MPEVEPALGTDVAALEALRKLPVYRDAQADFKRTAKDDSSLDKSDWSEWSQTKSYGSAGKLTAIAAGLGEDCGSYTDSAISILHRENGQLKSLLMARPAPCLPYLVIDLDADGVLEFLLFYNVQVGSLLGRIAGSGFLKLKRFPYSYQDCGCFLTASHASPAPTA